MDASQPPADSGPAQVSRLRCLRCFVQRTRLRQFPAFKQNAFPSSAVPGNRAVPALPRGAHPPRRPWASRPLPPAPPRAPPLAARPCLPPVLPPSTTPFRPPSSTSSPSFHSSFLPPPFLPLPSFRPSTSFLPLLPSPTPPARRMSSLRSAPSPPHAASLASVVAPRLRPLSPGCAGSSRRAMWAVAGGLWGSRAGLRGLLRSWDAALLPGCARGVHGSAVFCKNWLKKFASKTKKKFWYEGPSLGSHLTYKPSKLEFLMKTTSKKTRKEDHVRMRALNGLLYKALTDLLCTPEVSQELYDLNVELSKVSLTPDFSACRVYWKTTLSAEQNAHMEAVLQRSAASMRHLLMSQQTMRNVPPIVFVKDKKSAALAEQKKRRSDVIVPAVRNQGQCCEGISKAFPGEDVPVSELSTAGSCLWEGGPISLTSYWQSQTLDPGMKEMTLYKMISGTPMPRNPVAPQSRPRAPACVVSIMRRSTSRLWSTKGGKIKGSGAWCGRGMRLS
uniref:Ribosome binding factor A n=1 Tax=Macaca fascicularis TaxID=9541 RepID=A0A7N9IAW8_MACFA